MVDSFDQQQQNDSAPAGKKRSFSSLKKENKGNLG